MKYLLIAILYALVVGFFIYAVIPIQQTAPNALEPMIITREVESTTLPKKVKTWRGEASVYTEEGCLGCSKNLIMANGEIFTNQKIIVAFNKLQLNTKVKVTNLKNGLSVIARVTDRGGFEKYNRIIDLGKATAQAINCNGLCQVKVEAI
jgi:rare lipoprotein A (peptidoglycan hydrolase)